jgi:Pretoxin HINT domain
VAEAAHRVPGGDEWVLVLGAAEDAGHWRLADVEPGERFAFQGRVFDTSDADGDGRLEVRATGDVIGRVVNTFVRHAPEVIDAEITYADGTTDVLTGTPNHPFWVDAVRDYVPLGELQVGTQLHVQGGGAAMLVSKTWRQGDFEVFDFEVEGLHNFYVRGPDGDAPGVLVHNSTTMVTSWADAGITPDLNPGRWVMLGGQTRLIYIKSGLWGPKVDFATFPPTLTPPRAPFSNAVTGTVPTSSLSWPPGLEFPKGLLGQRVLTPAATPLPTVPPVVP